jgi:5-methylcytosine-specific restriction endonuclease McrA
MADADYKRKHQAREKRDIACGGCGQLFTPKLANGIYCSKKCKLAAWKRNNPERHKQNVAKESQRIRSLRSEPSLSRARKALIRSLRNFLTNKIAVATRHDMAARPCALCGNPVGYVFGRSRRYCSDRCKRKSRVMTDAEREYRKAAKKYRRAKERGIDGEIFSPLEIFLRDGWRCQICGVSTPPSRRGTRHHNAPEIDHIVPLSKGGKHLRTNVQCACHSCNAYKSNRMIVGQYGLLQYRG